MTSPGGGAGASPAAAGTTAGTTPGTTAGTTPGTTAAPAPAPGRPARRPARRGDPWRTAFVCVLGLAIIVGAAWALLGSSLLVVRNIQVTGSQQVPAARVRAAAAIRPGTPMARLDSGAVARRVERIAQVRSAQVSRSWPDTVVITVQARIPALAVRAAGQFELVDVAGVVVRTAASRPPRMPLLREPPFQLRGSPAVRSAVLVLNHLPAAIRGRVTSVTADSVTEAVTLRLRGGISVRWGGPGRSAAKARELQALMRTHSRHFDVSSPQVAVTS